MADAVYNWVMTDSNPFADWQSIVGPVLLLFGLGVSVLGNSVWGGTIGNVSCRYRLSYSPYNEAFGIWLVIYPWFFACVFFQFFYRFDPIKFYVAKFSSNLCMCVSWASSGAWTFFFGTGDSPNPEIGLGMATFFLLLAATTAMSAVFIEQGFRVDSTITQIFTVSIPFSLYAGWLIVAASINVGIFITIQRTNDTDTIGLCERSPTNPSQPDIPNPRSWIDASLPLVLATAVSVVSVSQSDPVLLVPIVWAIALMKRDTIKIVSICLAALSWGVSVVLFFQKRLSK